MSALQYSTRKTLIRLAGSAVMCSCVHERTFLEVLHPLNRRFAFHRGALVRTLFCIYELYRQAAPCVLRPRLGGIVRGYSFLNIIRTSCVIRPVRTFEHVHKICRLRLCRFHKNTVRRNWTISSCPSLIPSSASFFLFDAFAVLPYITHHTLYCVIERMCCRIFTMIRMPRPMIYSMRHPCCL